MTDEYRKMIDESQRRQCAKYRRRTDPERVKRVLSARHEQAVENWREGMARLAPAQAEACRLADEAGVSGWQRFWYRSYANQVYACWRRRDCSNMPAELAELLLRWSRRGLDAALLQSIEHAALEALEQAERQQ